LILFLLVAAIVANCRPTQHHLLIETHVVAQLTLALLAGIAFIASNRYVNIAFRVCLSKTFKGVYAI